MITVLTELIPSLRILARRRGSLTVRMRKSACSKLPAQWSASKLIIGLSPNRNGLECPSSAAPLEGPGLDRVAEGPAFGLGATVFAFEPVIPFRLCIGVVDQGERRIEAQALLLTLHDIAVLVQERPNITAQNGLQHIEPGRSPVDAVVDLGHPVGERGERGQVAHQVPAGANLLDTDAR